MPTTHPPCNPLLRHALEPRRAAKQHMNIFGTVHVQYGDMHTVPLVPPPSGITFRRSQIPIVRCTRPQKVATFLLRGRLSRKTAARLDRPAPRRGLPCARLRSTRAVEVAMTHGIPTTPVAPARRPLCAPDSITPHTVIHECTRESAAPSRRERAAATPASKGVQKKNCIVQPHTRKPQDARPGSCQLRAACDDFANTVPLSLPLAPSPKTLAAAALARTSCAS